MKTPGAISDSELAEAFLRVEEITKWCTDVSYAALQRALTGSVLPGLKVVTGREGNRNWADAKAIAGALPLLIGDSAYKPREVISPTDAERLLGKAQPAEWDSLQQFITRPPGRPSLVRDTDSRPALGAVSLEFPIVS